MYRNSCKSKTHDKKNEFVLAGNYAWCQANRKNQTRHTEILCRYPGNIPDHNNAIPLETGVLSVISWFVCVRDQEEQQLVLIWGLTLAVRLISPDVF